MLYSKKTIYFNKITLDKRPHDSSLANDITDLDINDRVTQFQDQLKIKFVYRIPLCYFTYLGKINFLLKIDFSIKCHLKTDMKKLLKSEKKVTTVGAPDGKIIFTKAPFIEYEQVLLDKNFRQYLETIMVSKKILHMGVQKTPIQKTYEIAVGSDTIIINFLGSIIQIDWLEISLVFDKSDKNKAIYESCNNEFVTKHVKSGKMTNFTETYSLANEKKYDMDNLTQKHSL